ncbi:hypothetical protein [Alkalihalobacillus sp. LMS39]|nr:hypothetical protein [Alkalihalobacillus sp. LMS39]UOE93441.1 hypothetical protein MM271_19960 [Alkalihalobacillus sp. LMS39]
MKEHKLTGTVYETEGEMMVREQLMDSYRTGTHEDSMEKLTNTSDIEN